MPSQADEEAHQLSYMQKHLSNIISLLTDVSERGKVMKLWFYPWTDLNILDFWCILGKRGLRGFSKSSYVKQATDLKGTSVKVVNCHESVIYILAPMKYATVYGCSDATIVLGAVGKVSGRLSELKITIDAGLEHRGNLLNSIGEQYEQWMVLMNLNNCFDDFGLYL